MQDEAGRKLQMAEILFARPGSRLSNRNFSPAWACAIPICPWKPLSNLYLARSPCPVYCELRTYATWNCLSNYHLSCCKLDPRRCVASPDYSWSHRMIGVSLVCNLCRVSLSYILGSYSRNLCLLYHFALLLDGVLPFVTTSLICPELMFWSFPGPGSSIDSVSVNSEEFNWNSDELYKDAWPVVSFIRFCPTHIVPTARIIAPPHAIACWLGSAMENWWFGRTLSTYETSRAWIKFFSSGRHVVLAVCECCKGWRIVFGAVTLPLLRLLNALSTSCALDANKAQHL